MACDAVNVLIFQ